MERRKGRRLNGKPSNKNGGRRHARQDGQKQRTFKIYPYTKFDRNNPPRIALVYWRGGGEPLEYRLDHFDSAELRSFWYLDYDRKADYLREKFNRHHRRPRCRKGLTVRENLSYVDICSHNCYNKLISAVACWSGILIKSVETSDIERFLKKTYPYLKRLVSNDGSERLKSLESSLDQRNIKNNLHPVLIVNIAKWSNVKSKSLHVQDVCRFVEYLYPVLCRLAFDHELGKLMTMTKLFATLNEIWLPVDEQIKLGRHGKAHSY